MMGDLKIPVPHYEFAEFPRADSSREGHDPRESPEQARVASAHRGQADAGQRRLSPPTDLAPDINEESDVDDDMFDGGVHGHEAPETPTLYFPASPMCVGRSEDDES